MALNQILSVSVLRLTIDGHTRIRGDRYWQPHSFVDALVAHNNKLKTLNILEIREMDLLLERYTVQSYLQKGKWVIAIV